MIQTIKIVKTLSPIVLALGILYLASSLIALYNWCTGLAEASSGHQLYPSFIPGDLGLAIVTLTIGASLTASTYYTLKGDRVMHLASATCGLGLALGALIVQILVTLATVLDAIVVGEGIDCSIISENLLRVDAVLGYIAIPISIPYIITLKEVIKAK